MSLQLDIETLKKAFPDRTDIQGAIQAAAAAPEWIELFNIINGYVANLQGSLQSAEPASKKRKLDDTLTHYPAPTTSNGVSKTNGHTGSATAGTYVAVDDTALLQVKEVSIVIPQRKKYTLEFTSSHIRARNPADNELIPGINHAWQDITYAFCLPVPEKTAKQYNYILFPRTSYLQPKTTTTTLDPLLFTIPATAPKPNSISGTLTGEASSYNDTYKDLFDWAISRCLKDSGSKTAIEEPSPSQFTSAIKEGHRPNEKAMFVKAFRGSKDGYLFFLATGILWAFKKPVLFIPKSQVVAVSFTSVLQRTFNLNVEVAFVDDGVKTEEGTEESEEIEFAMLDQEDFEGINTYVTRHGLADKSMADQRKAKRLGVNDVKGENGNVVEDQVGALEAAQAEAQGVTEEDDEDSEGEDYDPGSEGESEGSGSSSEEESGDEGGDGGDDDAGMDDLEDGEGDEDDE